MSLLNTFVVSALIGEFDVPYLPPAKVDVWEPRFDEHGQCDSPDSQMSTDGSDHGLSASIDQESLLKTERQALEECQCNGTLSPTIEKERPEQKNPVRDPLQGTCPGNDLMTKILEIKARDAENWLRRLARLISPQSWETL
jgi:hypothetical protein